MPQRLKLLLAPGYGAEHESNSGRQQQNVALACAWLSEERAVVFLLALAMGVYRPDQA